MSEINRGALVKITWEDPTSAATWMGATDINEFMTDQTFIAESVGWIVAEDDDAFGIAATVNAPNSYVGQIFRIPKNALVGEVEILRDQDG